MKHTLLAVVIGLGLAGGIGLGLEAKTQESRYHVHEVKAYLMAQDRRFGKKLAVLPQGTEVTVGEASKGGWFKVTVNVDGKPMEGYLPFASLTFGSATLRVGQSGDRRTGTDTVQLAARGFSADVEAQYAKQNAELDFQKVDALEAVVPDPEVVGAFAAEGKLELEPKDRKEARR